MLAYGLHLPSGSPLGTIEADRQSVGAGTVEAALVSHTQPEADGFAAEAAASGTLTPALSTMARRAAFQGR